MNANSQNLGASTAGFSPVSVLTRAELLDHVRHPRNRGPLPDADIIQEEANPLCGDVVTVYAKLEKRNEERAVQNEKRAEGPLDSFHITHCSFLGQGCIISQAAASMLSEAVGGKSLGEVQQMERAHMETLLGGQLSPSRVKCAMLPLIALKAGLTHGYTA